MEALGSPQSEHPVLINTSKQAAEISFLCRMSGLKANFYLPSCVPSAIAWCTPPQKFNYTKRRRRLQELWLFSLLSSHFLLRISSFSFFFCLNRLNTDAPDTTELLLQFWPFSVQTSTQLLLIISFGSFGVVWSRAAEAVDQDIWSGCLLDFFLRDFPNTSNRQDTSHPAQEYLGMVGWWWRSG